MEKQKRVGWGSDPCYVSGPAYPSLYSYVLVKDIIKETLLYNSVLAFPCDVLGVGCLSDSNIAGYIKEDDNT